jgi:hypothetical protein
VDDHRRGTGTGIFVSSPNRPGGLRNSRDVLPNGYRVQFCGVNSSGHEAGHIFLNFNVTNAWICTSIHPYFFTVTQTGTLAFICNGGIVVEGAD